MTRWLPRALALAFALIALIPPAIALAQQGYYGHGPDWHGGWYGMVFGPLMMILFVAVIVVVAVLAVRWLGGAGAGRGEPPRVSGAQTPLEILEERFARGEIDKDEFEERRRVLRG